MLEIRNLCAGYPGCPVLSGINASIPAGQITAIIGPNGCGKSTLLKAIVRINPPSAGIISIDGVDTASLSAQELAQNIAYLPQNRQTPDITALRLVLHGRFPYLSYPRHYRPQDLEIARRAMQKMGILDLANRPLGTLSGGMRQKVYISMALAQDAPVILMDEPTSFLDAAHQLQLMDHARMLAAEGKAVAMVLHDLSMALQTADQVIVMKSGRILYAGDPESAYSSGYLTDAFGVRVHRFPTPGGWQYYYRSAEKE